MPIEKLSQRLVSDYVPEGELAHVARRLIASRMPIGDAAAEMVKKHGMALSAATMLVTQICSGKGNDKAAGVRYADFENDMYDVWWIINGVLNFSDPMEEPSRGQWIVKGFDVDEAKQLVRNSLMENNTSLIENYQAAGDVVSWDYTDGSGSAEWDISDVEGPFADTDGDDFRTKVDTTNLLFVYDGSSWGMGASALYQALAGKKNKSKEAMSSDYEDYVDEEDGADVVESFNNYLVPAIESKGPYIVEWVSEDKDSIFFNVMDTEAGEESFVTELWKAQAWVELTSQSSDEFADAILDRLRLPSH